MILETVPAPHPHELTGHPVSNRATRLYAGTLANTHGHLIVRLIRK